MFERSLQYIIDNYPIIATYVVVIIGTVYVTIYVYKLVHKLNDTKNKVDKLPCNTHHNNISDINVKHNTLIEKIDSTNRIIEDLRNISINKYEAIEELCAWVMKKDKAMIDVLKKHSPLSMTKVGQIIFEKMPTQKLVDDNIDYLLEEVRKEDPQTAFDVEDISLKVMLRNISHPMYNDLKNYLYYSPETLSVFNPETNTEIEIEVSMTMAMQLMGIYLRDKYLNKFPNLLEIEKINS